MNILLNLKEALQSLNANKMRSILTILGIVIGVASVIALLSLGESARNSITGQIESIGTNVIYILNGNNDEDVINPQDLTLRDAEVLANSAQASKVAYVAPIVGGVSEVSHSDVSVEMSISGITPDYLYVQNLTIAEGTFITDAQVEGRSAVVVLGPQIATTLYGRSTGIVGQTVRIGGYPFRVIGVTEAKGGSAFNNPDNNLYIPISTAQTRLPHAGDSNRVQQILVSVAKAEDANEAIEQIKAVLRTTHRIPPRSPDDFSILNQQDFLDVASSITGGIDIINIMLVSVTERTREIGLRKALGARKRDILIQFLTESVLLSMIGGLIGILLGWGISLGVSQIAASSGTPLVVSVTLNSISLATLFSAVVGIFFGYYPANRAASLAPVEALRYE